MQIINDFAVKLLILSFVLALLPQSPFVGFGSLVQSVPFISEIGKNQFNHEMKGTD